MKRICSLFLFVCLLLIGFFASANVFSHRYFHRTQITQLNFQFFSIHSPLKYQNMSLFFTNRISI